MQVDYAYKVNSPSNIKIRFHRKVLATLKWALLLLITIFCIFPIVIAFLGSFKSNAELTGGATIFPNEWIFTNYVEAWTEANFALFTWNSLFISVMATAGTLIVASMAAFIAERRVFPMKKTYVAIQAATMFISVGAIVLRPQFEIMISLSLHNTLWGVIIILISAHASTFFILYGFMNGIPRELDEAAVLDGYSTLGTYWRIIIPLLKPGLAVCALFQFRTSWNEYILPLVFTMSQPNLQPLTVGLANLRYGASAAVQTHLMLAGACLSIIPIVIVYFLANKAFMQVTAGSIKG